MLRMTCVLLLVYAQGMGDDAGPTEDEFEEEADDGTPF